MLSHVILHLNPTSARRLIASIKYNDIRVPHYTRVGMNLYAMY